MNEAKIKEMKAEMDRLTRMIGSVNINETDPIKLKRKTIQEEDIIFANGINRG